MLYEIDVTFMEGSSEVYLATKETIKEFKNVIGYVQHITGRKPIRTIEVGFILNFNAGY